jgi:hypothetical protein
MEELKLLVDMVASLPQMALWVVVMFFIYKVTVIGSIYGVIRFVTTKLVEWLTTQKVQYKEVRPVLDGMAIGGQLEYLIAQISRVKGKSFGKKGGYGYIHGSDVEWLAQAITEKEERDDAANKKPV